MKKDTVIILNQIKIAKYLRTIINKINEKIPSLVKEWNTKCISVSYPCEDCKWSSPLYMVKDETWEKAVPGYSEMDRHFYLCLRCLEERLDRGLSIVDFTNVPANIAIFYGMSIGVEVDEKD